MQHLLPPVLRGRRRHRDRTAAQVWRVLEDTAGRTWSASKPSIYLGYGFARARQILTCVRGRPGPADRNTNPWDVQPLSGSPSHGPALRPSTTGAKPTAGSFDDSGLPLTGLALGAAAIFVLGAGALWPQRHRRAR
ncbi:hypothetical protein [Streptomyces sp. NPDC002676]